MGELHSAAEAYREIKRRIVELEYRLGERLSETRIASELNLGRSPVRSAFARLKSEGWIGNPFPLKGTGSQIELHVFFVYPGFLSEAGNHEANGQGKFVRADLGNAGQALVQLEG